MLCWLITGWVSFACLKRTKNPRLAGCVGLVSARALIEMPIAFAAWGLRYGPISEGLCVLHRCDNPGCCNPNHLFVGTQRRNIEDRDSKGRQARGEKQHLAKLTWLDVCLIRLLGLVRMSTAKEREPGVTARLCDDTAHRSPLFSCTCDGYGG